MKTVGLAVALVQSGSFAPAASGAKLPVFPSLLAVADPESGLEVHLSTFQAHAADLSALLRDARPDGLVLLDEIGVGTDPGEAAALAQAVLEHLVEGRSLTLATTHLGPLKAFADGHPCAVNAAVGLDEAGQPTFVLQLGAAGRSFALDVARQQGLPEAVCARAAELHRGSQ
jgi:DNA mismatch repair protein MutS2